ncbi:heme transporter, partial [Burkholderia sp. SIMBA_013]
GRSLQEDARRSERFVAAGQGTRTDQLEIEARARVVQAQEIEARDKLRDARNALGAIVGPALAEQPLAPLRAAALAGLAVEGRDL